MTVMAARKAAERCRPPGSLRLVTKHAKGHPYRRWQWRTHHRSDLGWRTVDVELGRNLAGMRTRVLIALGELSAPLLLERWIRWRFRHWSVLPSWTGRPDASRRIQRAAWWIELPRRADDPVRLRFRSLDGSCDFRRSRAAVAHAELIALDVWRDLTANPIADLARLLWLQQQAQEQIDVIAQELINLRRLRRRGDLSQRDYEADERGTYLRLEGWESMHSRVSDDHDDLLVEMVAAMPRTRRDADRSRILAAADRLLNDPKRRAGWHADHWDGSTLRW